VAVTSNCTSSDKVGGSVIGRGPHTNSTRPGRRIWGGGGLPSAGGGCHLLGRPLGAGASASASYSRFQRWRRQDHGFRRAGASVRAILRSHHLYCSHRSPDRTCPPPLPCRCVFAVFLVATTTPHHHTSYLPIHIFDYLPSIIINII